MHDPTSSAYKKARRQYLKATKSRNKDVEQDWTPFRAAEKRFKARFPPPDLSDVLDLSLLDGKCPHGVWSGSLDESKFRELLMPPGSLHRAFTLRGIPGFVVFPSFLSVEEQKVLVRWSLAEQARPPNITNLDVHYRLPENGIWNAMLQSRQDPSRIDVVLPKAATQKPEASRFPEDTGSRQLINNPAASKHNLDAIMATPKPDASPSSTVPSMSPSALVKKLRWANLGWYYHWSTKQYDFTRGKQPVDRRVRDICQKAVQSVDWSSVFDGREGDWGDESLQWQNWGEKYEPDAGIVNFYQVKDTLMGHVDHSEVCATAPLVSISLGNSAIFLIGGTTRETPPTPILLRSGDIVVMAGPACRRAYHGVPRILDDSLPPSLAPCEDSDPDWTPYGEYMSAARININVRQVFPVGFNPPKEIQKRDSSS
ncbi:hypothetical protein FISHEDRAFT_38493 [Fistulina hepatica ATCC 64428]|nr:hypothetical protein FISHEDRAFT_38493 [Fistulina hepatica ATCC 64428]